MGLFDEQVKQVKSFMAEELGAGRLRIFKEGEVEPWPSDSTLVLEDDTAVELGNPSIASLSFLVWSEGDDVEDGLISLVGPDVGESVGESLPLAQVLLVKGSFDDEYETFREVRDAVYGTQLSGFMVRTMPSKQNIWCRVSGGAVNEGFSLANLGARLIENLREVERVEGAEALFVTSGKEDVKRLASAGSGARRLVEALMKMYEDANFDCETCEYRDVCDTVADLKRIRRKLKERAV